MTYDEIRRRLRQARESAGLTQRQLAALIPVDHATVSEWERGAVVANTRSLFDWAQALGKEVVIR